MGLGYCPECGKLYMANPAGICPACQEAEEPLAQKVTDYLREVKTATLEEVHEATGVKHKTILRMIKNGRVRTEHDIEIYYNCERCGAPISEGRMCARCSKAITDEISAKVKEWNQDENPNPLETKVMGRMYTKDKQ